MNRLDRLIPNVSLLIPFQSQDGTPFPLHDDRMFVLMNDIANRLYGDGAAIAWRKFLDLSREDDLGRPCDLLELSCPEYIFLQHKKWLEIRVAEFQAELDSQDSSNRRRF
ncbi:MAG: hypothetical protein GY715_09200 [Planctomycetes bacterium]|nr:hypothetical protein [Planctomycetota bacterium]